ncbi:MAG: hypothetical protein FWD58_01605 [Firmicutes bacterium]|nr:hypothetical protein [Bacillota bacterium]
MEDYTLKKPGLLFVGVIGAMVASIANALIITIATVVEKDWKPNALVLMILLIIFVLLVLLITYPVKSG